MNKLLLISISLCAASAYGAVISASGIIGQGGVYTTNTADYPSGSINASGLHGFTSTAIDTVNHRLFGSDNVNKRVLVFDLDSNNAISSTAASHVLGVCNFTSAGSGAVTDSTFGTDVVNLAYDSVNQRLFVSDWAHNRVLMFLVAPGFSDCEAATAVFGQTGFTTSATTVLNGPDDIEVDTDHNRLFVSSQGSARVQVFDCTPGVTGGVTSVLFTLGTGNTNPLQNTVNQPTGAAYDSVNQRLFITDTGNNRVMVFPVPSTCDSSCNGENATFVLGQAAFNTGTSGHTQSTLSQPDDCNYDVTGNRFFVTDWNNLRIMMWVVPSNATSSFNGANATANINNVSWTGGTIGTPPTQNSFNHPEAPHAYDAAHNRYLIYEYILGTPTNGNRVLQLDFIHISTSSLPNGVKSTAYSQSVSVVQTQGTSQTYTVTSGALPNGLSLNSSTGAITGTPTALGIFTFTIHAADNFSDGSVFFDDKEYSVSINSYVSNASVIVIQ